MATGVHSDGFARAVGGSYTCPSTAKEAATAAVVNVAGGGTKNCGDYTN